jgi:alcohol dehydrogenase class IV
MSATFTWRDGERTIRFGRGTIATAGELLGGGYTLLTTPRAEGAAPHVVANARAVHHVRPGRVDEIAEELRGTVRGDLLVALGGGRVVDVTKALAAAAGPPVRAAAIPTTLSAAEMSRGHRQAAGVDPKTPNVRPAIVVNDPDLSASQPAPELAASAANSLAHAVEGAVTTNASPVPVLAAREAVRLTEAAYAGAGDEPDREALALAALLSGYTIDQAGLALHHVLAQTLVRLGGADHGPANAAMLPHTIPALVRRNPATIDATAIAIELARRAGAERLRDIGVDESKLEDCVQAAAERPQLKLTPPPADAGEIRALYRAAW